MNIANVFISRFKLIYVNALSMFRITLFKYLFIAGSSVFTKDESQKTKQPPLIVRQLNNILIILALIK
jgi:hypothetical protein